VSPLLHNYTTEWWRNRHTGTQTSTRHVL